MAKKNSKNLTTQPVAVTVNNSNMVTVKSKLPWDLTFVSYDGKIKVIKGMKTSLLVKLGSMGSKYATSYLSLEDWKYFCDKHNDQKYLKNQVIFAETSEKVATDKAKELENDSSTVTKLEQADPAKDKELKKIKAYDPDGLGAD